MRTTRAQRPLAACLDTGVGRLHQHREVGRQPVRVHPGQARQAVEARVHLLALVEHVGHVAHRLGHCRGAPQRDRDSALHVARAQAEQQRPRRAGAGGCPPRGRCPGARRPRTRSARPSAVRATTVSPSRSTRRCASAAGRDSTASASGALAVRLARDVDQVGGEGDDVGGPQVEAGRRASRRLPQPGDLPLTLDAPCSPRHRPGRRARAGHLRRRRAAGRLVPGPAPWARRPLDVHGVSARRSTPRGRGSPDDGRHGGRRPAGPARLATADAYLRLHLLSHRLVRPRTVNLDGVFGLLRQPGLDLPRPVPGRPGRGGPAAGRGPEGQRWRSSASTSSPGWSTTWCPSGVRVADADRVRLGRPPGRGHHGHARGLRQLQRRHAGCLDGRGPHLARASWSGDGSDVGGGASIMGTLSGGGSEVITIGERCLVGANAGVGISPGRRLRGRGRVLRHRRRQGDRCPTARWSRPATLSGAPACCSCAQLGVGRAGGPAPRSGSWGGLNAALHAND